jgi:hypothetical protein
VSMLRLLLVAVAALTLAAPASAGDFWVAPGGDDRGPGTRAAPFRTMGRAQTATRRATGPDTVTLRGGVYRLVQPLTLDARDSNVTWQAAPGETPVLSGGAPVTGWKPLPDGRWTAPLRFATRQLYVNGRRALLAQGPAPKLIRTTTGYETADGSALSFRSPRDLELVFDVLWRESRGRVASIDGGTITMQQPFFANALLDRWATIDLPTRFENAPELVDQPGEWYLDRVAGTALYLPRPGEDLPTADVVAPRLQRLVTGGGSLDHPLHDVVFSGITFADTTWLPSTADGVVDSQANLLLVGRHATIDGTDDKLVKMPAAVSLRAAQSVRFTGDRFVRLGGAALDLSYGSRSDVVEGCEVADVSGNGIQLGDVTDHHPRDPRATTSDITVANNWIHDVAVEYRGGVGIWAGYVARTSVAHNELSSLPYTAISIGWGWGLRDTPPTPMQNNIVEANDVHDVMQVLVDGGAIYLLGGQPGSVVRGNVVSRVTGWGGAIYLDDGSIDETVEDNVVVSFHAWPYMFKGTRLTIRHNVWDVYSDWGFNFFHDGTVEDNKVVDDPFAVSADRLAAAGPGPGYLFRSSATS